MSIPTPPDPRAHQLRARLENMTNGRVAMDDNFQNALGLDSLDIAGLATVIDNTFDVDIPMSHPSLVGPGACGNAILEHLNEKLGPAAPTHGLLLKLTEDQFIARYRPEENQEGGYYRQRDWSGADDLRAINEVVKDNRVWTAVDDDNGEFCIVAGMRHVNRLYYIITEKPAENEDWEIVAQDRP